MGSKRRAKITFLESTKKLQSWQTHCSCQEDRDTEEKERTVPCALGMEISHMAKKRKGSSECQKEHRWALYSFWKKGRRYRKEELQHPQRNSHPTEPQNVYGAALRDSRKERHIKGIIILSTSLAWLSVSQPSWGWILSTAGWSTHREDVMVVRGRLLM